MGRVVLTFNRRHGSGAELGAGDPLARGRRVVRRGRDGHGRKRGRRRFSGKSMPLGVDQREGAGAERRAGWGEADARGQPGWMGGRVSSQPGSPNARGPGTSGR